MRDYFYTDAFMWDVLKIRELPSRLCQFTSVDALERIVTSRNLRFSRLDRVNDPEEAMAEDLPHAATSIFVSCWTGPDVETLPMWSVYGDQMRGVRLTLPTDLFRGRPKAAVLEEGGAITSINDWFTIERPFPAMGGKGRLVIGPNKVFYSNDPAYRSPRMVHRREGQSHVYPYDLGMVKGTDWAFEDEWRFKIALMSFGAIYPDDDYFNTVTLDLKTYPVTTEALFVPLDPGALDELDVMLGPKADQTVADRVTEILAAAVPRATISRSRLKVR
ncbi:MAG: DUF2971 domain-containing protein [Brevundimonas sp.]|uniref:DUF2971 domain-containing protein n=1 Tax=Brevundimonas sp. TaxID=1871086 RepID=UPI00391BD126